MQFFSWIPTTLLLLYSPLIVPKHINYKTFINLVVILLALFILTLPLLRDLLEKKQLHHHKWIIYLNLILINSINPKVFCPFINFLINEKAKRNHRTAINAIIFILTTIFSSLFLNLMSYFFSMTFSS